MQMEVLLVCCWAEPALPLPATALVPWEGHLHGGQVPWCKSAGECFDRASGAGTVDGKPQSWLLQVSEQLG